MNLILLVVVVLVVLGLLVWVIRSYAPIPPTFKWIIIFLLVVVACWYLLTAAGIV